MSLVATSNALSFFSKKNSNNNSGVWKNVNLKEIFRHPDGTLKRLRTFRRVSQVTCWTFLELALLEKFKQRSALSITKNTITG